MKKLITLLTLLALLSTTVFIFTACGSDDYDPANTNPESDVVLCDLEDCECPCYYDEECDCDYAYDNGVISNGENGTQSESETNSDVTAQVVSDSSPVSANQGGAVSRTNAPAPTSRATNAPAPHPAPASAAPPPPPQSQTPTPPPQSAAPAPQSQAPAQTGSAMTSAEMVRVAREHADSIGIQWWVGGATSSNASWEARWSTEARTRANIESNIISNVSRVRDIHVENGRAPDVQTFKLYVVPIGGGHYRLYFLWGGSGGGHVPMLPIQ